MKLIDALKGFLSLCVGSLLIAVPAEARRTVVDDTLIPDFLFSPGSATSCTSEALCFSAQLPYALDLGGGVSSSTFFVNRDGVITFGAEEHAYDSLDTLSATGFNFAAPVYAPDYLPGFARIGITTEQDIRANAAYKLQVCEFFPNDVEFICTGTVDEFIAANNYNRYLGDVVVQVDAGFLLLRRNQGGVTGTGTLFYDEDRLNFDLGISDFESDYRFVGQGRDRTDSFGFSISAGVPEPQIWVMLIFGFGLLGRRMRQGKAPVSEARSRVCKELQFS